VNKKNPGSVIFNPNHNLTNPRCYQVKLENYGIRIVPINYILAAAGCTVVQILSLTVVV